MTDALHAETFEVNALPEQAHPIRVTVHDLGVEITNVTNDDRQHTLSLFHDEFREIAERGLEALDRVETEGTPVPPALTALLAAIMPEGED